MKIQERLPSTGETKSPAIKKVFRHSKVTATQARRTSRKGNDMVTFPSTSTAFIPLGTLSSSERVKPYRLVTNMSAFYGTTASYNLYSLVAQQRENILTVHRGNATRLHLTTEDAGKRQRTMHRVFKAVVLPPIQIHSQRCIGVLGQGISVSFTSQRNERA